MFECINHPDGRAVVRVAIPIREFRDESSAPEDADGGGGRDAMELDGGRQSARR